MNITQIKQANKATGRGYLDFLQPGDKVHPAVYQGAGGIYFIFSFQVWADKSQPRTILIKRFCADASIRTAGSAGTLEDAITIAKRISQDADYA